eukprot:6502641-Heterocapsa_arctica.AAC.1
MLVSTSLLNNPRRSPQLPPSCYLLLARSLPSLLLHLLIFIIVDLLRLGHIILVNLLLVLHQSRFLRLTLLELEVVSVSTLRTRRRVNSTRDITAGWQPTIGKRRGRTQRSGPSSPSWASSSSVALAAAAGAVAFGRTP